MSSRKPWISVNGELGRLDVDITEASLTLETISPRREFQFPTGDFGWRNMITEFADSIEQGRPPVMSAEEGLDELRVVLTVYESVRTGVPATLTRSAYPVRALREPIHDWQQLGTTELVRGSQTRLSRHQDGLTYRGIHVTIKRYIRFYTYSDA